jgi:hypothetical protein
MQDYRTEFNSLGASAEDEKHLYWHGQLDLW